MPNKYLPATRRIQKGDSVFVYGTLRKGFGNHAALGMKKNAEYIMTSHIRGKLYDVGGRAFPCYDPCSSVPDSELNSYVEGEIYIVGSEDQGRRLDMLEGFNINNTDASMYVRCRLTAQDFFFKDEEEQGKLMALLKEGTLWVYVWNGATSTLESVKPLSDSNIISWVDYIST